MLSDSMLSASVNSRADEEEEEVNILETLDKEGLMTLAEQFSCRNMTMDEFIVAIRSVNVNAQVNHIANFFKRIDREDKGYIEWKDVADAFTVMHAHTSEDTADAQAKRLFREDVFLHEKVPNKVCKHTMRISRMLMHPRLPMYYSCSEDGSCRIWNARNLEFESILHNGQAACTDMVYCKESDSLAICSVDRLISIYDSHGKLKKVLKTSKSRIVDNIPGASEQAYFLEFRMPKFSDKAPTFFGHDATGLEDSSVMKMLSSRSNYMLQRMWARQKHFDPVDVILLSKSPYVTYSLGYWNDKITHGECLFLGMEHGHVHLYNIPKSYMDPFSGVMKEKTSVEPLLTTRAHKDTVTSLIVDTENETIYTGSRDSDIHVIHIERGNILRTLSGNNVGNSSEQFTRHCKGVHSMDWSDSLRVLASVGVERHVILWNPIVPTPLGYLPGHNTRIVSAKFCAKQFQIFTYCADRTVRLWDTRTLRCMQVFRQDGTESEASTGTLLYDDIQDRLVTATKSIFVHTRKAHMESIASYNGHMEPVILATRSEETGRVLSVDGTTIRLWESETSASVYAWENAQRILHLAVDSTGTRIIINSLQGVFVYRASKGQLLNTFAEIPVGVEALVQHVSNTNVMLWAVALPKKIVFYKDDYIQRMKETARQNETVELAVWVYKYIEVSDRVTAMKVCGTHLLLGTSGGKVLGIALTINSLMNSLSKFIVYSPLVCANVLVSFFVGPLHEDVRVRIMEAHAVRQKRLLSESSSQDTSVNTSISMSLNTSASFLNQPHRNSLSFSEKIRTSVVSQRIQIECFVPLTQCGTYAFSTSGGGMIRLWDFGSQGRERFCWRGTWDANIAIYCCDVNTDATRLFTADEFGYIATYDLSTFNYSSPSHTDIKRLSVHRVSEQCITSLSYIPSLEALLVSSMDTSVRYIQNDHVLNTIGSMTTVGVFEKKHIRLHEYDGVVLARHFHRMQYIVQLVERRQRGLTAQEIIENTLKATSVFCDLPESQIGPLVLSMLRDMSPADHSHGGGQISYQHERLLSFNPADNTYNIPLTEADLGQDSRTLLSLQKTLATDDQMEESLVSVEAEAPGSPRRAGSTVFGKRFRGAGFASFSVPNESPIQLSTPPTTAIQQQQAPSAPSSTQQVATTKPTDAPRPKPAPMDLKEDTVRSQLPSPINRAEPQSPQSPQSPGLNSLNMSGRSSPRSFRAAGLTLITQMFQQSPPASPRQRKMTLDQETASEIDTQETSARAVILDDEFHQWKELLDVPMSIQERQIRSLIIDAEVIERAEYLRESRYDVCMVPVMESETRERENTLTEYAEFVTKTSAEMAASQKTAEEIHERHRYASYYIRPEPTGNASGEKHSPTSPKETRGFRNQQQRRIGRSKSVVQRKVTKVRRSLSTGDTKSIANHWNEPSVDHPKPDDWDRIFQDLVGLTCANQRQDETRRKELMRHIDKFNEACQEVVRAVQNDWTKAPLDRTRQARWVPHEPYMWEMNGISAKWVTNPVASRMLGGHSNARKAASNELRAIQALLNASMKLPRRLCVPLGCVITSCGMTFFCSPVLPFTDECRTNSAEYHILWKHACRALNIEGGPSHAIGYEHPKTHKLYVLHVGGLFPPLVSTGVSPNTNIECHGLRPEIIRGNQVALESEAFRRATSAFATSESSGVAQPEHDVGRVVKRLMNNVIPDIVARYLKSTVVAEDISNGRIVHVLQKQYGVNVALQSLVAFSMYDCTKPHSLPDEGKSVREVRNGVVLGKSECAKSLLSKTPTSAFFDSRLLDSGGLEPHEESDTKSEDTLVDRRIVFSVLVEEILARCTRDLAFQKMQECFLANYSTKQMLALMITDLVHRSSEGPTFWATQLMPKVKHKFAQPDVVPILTVEHVNLTRLFHRACDLTGAVYDVQETARMTDVRPLLKGLQIDTERMTEDGYETSRNAVFTAIELSLGSSEHSTAYDNLVEQPELLSKAQQLIRFYTRWPERHAKGLKIARSIVQVRKMFMRHRPIELARAYDDLGVLLTLQNKEKECIAAFTAAAEIFEKTLGRNHPITCSSLRRLSDVHHGYEVYDKAADLLTDVVQRLQITFQDESVTYNISPKDMCESLDSAAACLILADNMENSRTYLTRARDYLIESKSLITNNVAVTCQLAQVCFQLCDEEVALELYDEALVEIRLRYGVNHPEVANVLDKIGDVHRYAKNFPAAMSCYTRARAARLHTFGQFHYEVAKSFANIARINVDQDLPKKAIENYQTALHLMEATRGIDNAEAHAILHRIAELRENVGELELALEEYRKVLDSRERTLGPSHPHTVESMSHIGRIFYEQKKFREALQIFDVCYLLRTDSLGFGHFGVADSLKSMGLCYASLSLCDRAVGVYQQAVSTYEEYLKQDALRTSVRKEVKLKLCDALVCLAKVKHVDASRKLEIVKSLRAKNEEGGIKTEDELAMQRNTRHAETLLTHSKQNFELAVSYLIDLVKDPFHPTVMEYKRFMQDCITDLSAIEGMKVSQQHEIERNKLMSKWLTNAPGQTDSELASKTWKWNLANLVDTSVYQPKVVPKKGGAAGVTSPNKSSFMRKK
eukprot:PhF_6_TR7848/c0_g1_i1/m.11439